LEGNGKDQKPTGRKVPRLNERVGNNNIKRKKIAAGRPVQAK